MSAAGTKIEVLVQGSGESRFPFAGGHADGVVRSFGRNGLHRELHVLDERLEQDLHARVGVENHAIAEAAQIDVFLLEDGTRSRADLPVALPVRRDFADGEVRSRKNADGDVRVIRRNEAHGVGTDLRGHQLIAHPSLTARHIFCTVVAHVDDPFSLLKCTAHSANPRIPLFIENSIRIPCR